MALDLSATATSLLSTLGDPTYVKITRDTTGTLNPVDGDVTGSTEVLISAVGVVTKLKSSLIDGELIKRTDKMILLDNQTAPVMTDLITFNSIDHTIVAIDEVNHAGVTQLWKVVCRG